MIATYLFALILSLEVVNVHDGDTVTFRTGEGFIVKGRLIGVDCPEVAHRDRRGKRAVSPGQPFGEEAKNRLADLVKEPFQVKTFGSDVYGRSLILIQRGEKSSANEVLVQEGFCEVYRQSRKTKGFEIGPFEGAESKAKAAKLGIWGLKGYESPTTYRKRTRK